MRYRAVFAFWVVTLGIVALTFSSGLRAAAGVTKVRADELLSRLRTPSSSYRLVAFWQASVRPAEGRSSGWLPPATSATSRRWRSQSSSSTPLGSTKGSSKPSSTSPNATGCQHRGCSPFLAKQHQARRSICPHFTRRLCLSWFRPISWSLLTAK